MIYRITILLALLVVAGCSGTQQICPPVVPQIIEVDRPVPVLVDPTSVTIPDMPRLPIADLDSTSTPSVVARSWEVSAYIWIAYIQSLKELLCAVADCEIPDPPPTP